jgi:hypothetical protein
MSYQPTVAEPRSDDALSTVKGTDREPLARFVARELEMLLPRKDWLLPEQREGWPDRFRQHALHVVPDGAFGVVAWYGTPGRRPPSPSTSTRRTQASSAAASSTSSTTCPEDRFRRRPAGGLKNVARRAAAKTHLRATQPRGPHKRPTAKKLTLPDLLRQFGGQQKAVPRESCPAEPRLWSAVWV